MQNFIFLRGWEVFLSKKKHFFLVLGERAKRASPNPHRESRVKKAESHKPSVCQAFSARRPPSQLVVSEVK